jgi:hypothetical protein
MTTPSGGDAMPAAVVTTAPKGLIAIPAYVYTVATLPADVDIEGGDAQPIYLVSAGQLASGAFALQGDAAPVRLVTGTGRPALGDVAPIAVYALNP